MFVSLLMVAIAFSQATIVDGAPQLPGSWGIIALVFANLFVVSFGATWGPLMWVLLGEMFPNRIRATALGVGSAANWIANFLVTITFPVLSGFNLTVTYGIYALFALLSLFFVIAKIPETKGRSLEEMGITARATRSTPRRSRSHRQEARCGSDPHRASSVFLLVSLQQRAVRADFACPRGAPDHRPRSRNGRSRARAPGTTTSGRDRHNRTRCTAMPCAENT